MKFSKVSDKKRPKIYLYSIVNIISAASSTQLKKKSSYFVTGISEVSTETQSIGIHDVHLFNTEIAIHSRAIIKYGCFRLSWSEWETLLPCFGRYFSWYFPFNISRVVFHLIYCVNDFFDRFHKKLNSSDRLDKNENSMFKYPLGLLEPNFSRPHS